MGTDYMHTTDGGTEFFAWAVAKYPDDEAFHGFTITGDTAESWGKTSTIPLIEDGLDERGVMQYKRDPSRTDTLSAFVWHDIDARDECAALASVTMHPNTTLEEIRAFYPDHAAYGNIIAHIAA